MKIKTLKTLKELYQDIHELTFTKCKESCWKHGTWGFNCCSPEYCTMVIEAARKKGEILSPTDHLRLPLMGKDGCIAAPYQRPLCSIHICERFLWQDLAFAKKYFKLRNKLERLETKIWLQSKH